MKKINISSWKEFHVSELFCMEKHGKTLQVPTGAMLPKKLLEAGETPRVTVSNYNNGITGYYEDIDNKNYRVYENFISVSFLGTVFYQEKKASLDMKVHCLKPIKYELNVYSATFLVNVIRKAISNFAYQDQLSSTVLPMLVIKLPITTDGKPDWKYMESYARDVAKKAEKNLNNLRKIDTLAHIHQIDSWKSFKIGDLFENIIKPAVLHTKNVTEDSKGIPYVVRTKFNNGIKYHVTKTSYMQPSPAGTISFGAENATFFYQEKEYVSGRDIYYIDTRQIPKYASLFLITCLQKISEKYPYNYGLFPELVKKETIKLPVTAQGSPDWRYMDSYMKEIFQKAKHNLLLLDID